MDFIPTWGNAVAQFEGFFVPNSRPARNHNPGNLKFFGQPGTVGKDPDNFAVFSDDDAGFQALYRQLAKYVSDFPNYSIVQITAHYLGQSVPSVDSQGDAFTYSNFVAAQLGVDPSTTLGDLAAGAVNVATNLVNAALPDAGTPSGPVDPGSTSNLIVLVIGGGLIFWLISRWFGG